ncbi:MAG: hypothetical protein R3Y35_06675 [Clostridia bacterium]
MSFKLNCAYCMTVMICYSEEQATDIANCETIIITYIQEMATAFITGKFK